MLSIKIATDDALSCGLFVVFSLRLRPELSHMRRCLERSRMRQSLELSRMLLRNIWQTSSEEAGSQPEKDALYAKGYNDECVTCCAHLQEATHPILTVVYTI